MSFFVPSQPKYAEADSSHPFQVEEPSVLLLSYKLLLALGLELRQSSRLIRI